MQKANYKIAISIVLAVVIIAVTVLCAVTSGFQNWEFVKNNMPAENVIAYDDSGNGMISGESYPMPAKMMFTASDMGTQQMGTMALSSVTLTATVSPASASDKKVDWSVAWVNPNSSFATGKTVTDYLTATPTSDGALTATVSCVQSFGEKIKVIVTSRNNADAKAECTVDFARRLESTKLNVTYSNTTAKPFSFTNANQSLDLYPIVNPQAWYQIYGNVSSDSGKTWSCTNEFVYTYLGNYTVSNEITSTKCEVKISTELKNAMSSQGLSSDCVNWTVFDKVSYGDLIFRIGGVASMSGGGFLQVPAYNKLLAAFSTTVSSDFELRITVTAKYGDPIVTTYNCHYSHASAGLAVTGVSISDTTLTV